VNTDHLRTLIAVIEQGNFINASKKLGITQPGVSQRMKYLEQELGVNLIIRDNHLIHLTTEGKIVYDYALEIIRIEQQMRNLLNQLSDAVSGEIRIGASSVPGECMLPRMIRAFRERYPDIQITLQISGSKQMQEKLLRDEVDVIVVYGTVPDDRLLTHPIGNDQIVGICPVGHPWASAKIEFSDAKNQTWIAREKGSGTRTYLERAWREYGAEFLIEYTFGSTESIIAAVEAGLGVALISREYALRAKKLGRVEMFQIDQVSLERKFTLAVLKKLSNVSPIRQFIEYASTNMTLDQEF
jgi:LysR family transcriptional regulator, transcriptional activator of the cysJI operon